MGRLSCGIAAGYGVNRNPLFKIKLIYPTVPLNRIAQTP